MMLLYLRNLKQELNYWQEPIEVDVNSVQVVEGRDLVGCVELRLPRTSFGFMAWRGLRTGNNWNSVD
jgi:hypothetical protein